MYNIKFSGKIFMLLAATFSLAACNRSEETASNAQVKKAVAIVEPTEGNQVKGIVTFTEENGGLRIVADFTGLKPGKHGFHVHEHGDCSAHDASSAGGHFNPTNGKHGGPGNPDRHVGDMGNVEANEQGVGHYDRVDELMKLNGTDSIIGRSVVIHADEDDLTSQPSGNSGPRIGCGVIEAK